MEDYTKMNAPECKECKEECGKCNLLTHLILRVGNLEIFMRDLNQTVIRAEQAVRDFGVIVSSLQKTEYTSSVDEMLEILDNTPIGPSGVIEEDLEYYLENIKK